MSTQYQIKIERRDRLFYEQYRYSFQFRQHEIFAIRGLPDDEKLLCFIGYRKSWDTRFVVKQKRPECFTDESVANLQVTRDFLLTHATTSKLNVSGDWATIYTNDLSLIDQLQQLPMITSGCTVKQAVIDRPKDVVVIEMPRYKYRTYLRERKMSQDCKSHLLDWIQAQQDLEKVHACASKSLLNWLRNKPSSSWRNAWTQRYYYIEHNDLRYETMIGMIIPGFVRKSLPVISKEENSQAQLAAK